jgi:16S rRNA (cytosine1402-N4)-methyltransferase
MLKRASNPSGHQPVLVDEVVRLLVTDPEGTYLDLTAGGGGHLRALASALGRNARLYGLDRDPQAVARLESSLSGIPQQIRIITSSFDALDGVAHREGIDKCAGILLDLGLSSDQVDDPARGFSFREDGPLDMRFDRSDGLTAADLVNTKTEAELAEIFWKFGEEKDSRRIARRIVTERRKEMILTTHQLTAAVSGAVSPQYRTKSLARIFQALRIAVNQELERVERVLPMAVARLAPAGRVAVISYHSLEDRIVKHFFRSQSSGACTCPKQAPVCVCGARPTLESITRKPVVPTDDEITANPRARSAKLRVAVRAAV